MKAWRRQNHCCPRRPGATSRGSPSSQQCTGSGVAKPRPPSGKDALPPGTLWAAIIGGSLGIVLVLAEEWTPRKYRKYIPSAIGLGIGGIIPAFNSVAMFSGALAAWVLSKRRPDLLRQNQSERKEYIRKALAG